VNGVETSRVLVALTGAIPAVVAMWVIDRLDRKRPEPRSLRRLVTLCGMLSVVPAAATGVALGEVLGPPDHTYQRAVIDAFVVAAAVEEASKIMVVYWIVWRYPELDERMDGLVYASRAGLGFALVENVIFLLVVATTLEDQLTMWVLRAVFAVPAHALWTGMIGALAARRRFDGRGLGLAGGYLLAVALHGIYDLALFAQRPLELAGHPTIARIALAVPCLITVGSWFVLRSLARTALRLDDGDAARAAVASATLIASVPGPATR